MIEFKPIINLLLLIIKFYHVLNFGKTKRFEFSLANENLLPSDYLGVNVSK
jgi:hypothetical protein